MTHFCAIVLGDAPHSQMGLFAENPMDPGSSFTTMEQFDNCALGEGCADGWLKKRNGQSASQCHAVDLRFAETQAPTALVVGGRWYEYDSFEDGGKLESDWREFVAFEIKKLLPGGIVTAFDFHR